MFNTIFYGTKETYTDECTLTCGVTSGWSAGSDRSLMDTIWICIEDPCKTEKKEPVWICIDETTAIKLSKVLRMNINKIKPTV